MHQSSCVLLLNNHSERELFRREPDGDLVLFTTAQKARHFLEMRRLGEQWHLAHLAGEWAADLLAAAARHGAKNVRIDPDDAPLESYTIPLSVLCAILPSGKSSVRPNEPSRPAVRCGG